MPLPYLHLCSPSLSLSETLDEFVEGLVERTVAGLSSTEIVDVEEMVAMFLHVLTHDVKNHNWLRALDAMYIKVNVPAADHPTFRTRYPNAEGFLASHRGQWYHLQECRGVGNAVTNANVYFNMKHSLIRNVIEHAFVLEFMS
ncbi:putative nuclease HARBI1 [Cucumis melo var. makuwa]|uniref:Nuclease HARBI1 n=1 Tax=Cucumis melo var. makuwa TaxID=1194695 RepID=A0A5A7TL93_CUCMM|nr:putative nuclease HARBI1 [Cucumis melo var. makuwa]TYK22899.1 putative nuclease HARBI1 [Cucumis melo var. makuwa]